MRIVSGIYKGMKFYPPINMKARPTTDFAKENIFNVLTNLISFEGIEVLDLFSGTGSISYEFASRHAKKITAVEMSLTQIDFIKSVCKKLKINNISVYRSEVFRYLKKCEEKYDFIFADPPYKLKNITEIVELVFSNNLLKNNGLLVIEHGKDVSFENHKNLIDKRKYGSVNFSIFQENR